MTTTLAILYQDVCPLLNETKIVTDSTSAACSGGAASTREVLGRSRNHPVV